MSYGIIIQSRFSSSRLPGKALLKIKNKEMVLRQIQRLQHFIDIPIVLATSTDVTDDPIADLCKKHKIKCYRGPLNNLVQRLIDCAKSHKFKYIIRVGGDDPLIDPECCAKLKIENEKEKQDFIYASCREGWPYGCAAELISLNSLTRILSNTNDSFYLEHTIPYYFDNYKDFKIKKLPSPKNINRPNYYFSVDYEEDFKLINKIFEHFLPHKEFFDMKEIVNFIDNNKELLHIYSNLHNGFTR